MPLGWRVPAQEELVEHHFEQHDRVISDSTYAMVNSVHHVPLQLIDLSLDNAGVVIGLKFLFDLLPAGIGLLHREGAVLFLIF
jgi:predicted thioesterase